MIDMELATIFFSLKLIHIGALIFWLGPSLGAWIMLNAIRRQEGEFSSATHLAYRLFIKLLIVEHVAFIVLLGTGLGMIFCLYQHAAAWLQWKLLVVVAIIVPLEVLDIWYGNVKLPAIFSRFNQQGYDEQQTRLLRIYHRYITGAAIAIIPISVVAVMWLLIAKPGVSPILP